MATTAGLTSRPAPAGCPRVTALSIDAPSRRLDGRWLAAVGAVTLLGFVLRTLRLDYVNFHSDEAFFIQIAYQGTWLGSLGFNEPHPPLFLALLQGWMGLAGVSAFAIRLLPVLYGSLLPPVTYQLGRLLRSRRLGLAGAFVVAVNPVFIFYAREVRDNGLMAFTGALSLVLLLLALRRPRLLPAYVLAAAAALFSHYYDVAIVGLELALGTVWLARAGKLRLWPWAAAPLALTAAYAPWLLYARSTVANYDVGHGSLGVFWANLAETYQAFNFGFSVRPQDLLWPSVVVGALVLIGIAGAARARGALLAYALTPVAFGAMTLLHQTNFNPRYLFAGAPAYALLLGAGLVLLWRWHWALAAAACAFLLAGAGYTIRNTDFLPEFQPNGYREMVAYLQRHAAPGEAMVLDGVSQWPLYFYYGQLQAHLPQRVEFLPRDTADQTRATVDSLLGSGGVWYLETDLLRYDPTHQAERLLAANGYQASDVHFGGQRLEYFGGQASAGGGAGAAGVSVGGMRLASSAAGRSVAAGRALGAELDWTRGNGPVRPFKLSLRLDGADGTVAQNDTLPEGGYVDFAAWAAGQTLRERAGLLVPVGTVPGSYTLRALVYDAALGKPLGPALDLGQVHVDHSAPQNPAAAELPPVAAVVGGTPPRLVAAETPAGGVTPGDRAPLTLLWTGDRTPTPAHARVAVGPVTEDHVVGASYPTTAWKTGDVVRDVVGVRIPPSMAAGTYGVSVDGMPVGTVRVLEAERSFTIPPLAHQVGARFGDVAELAGYDTQPEGGGLRVQLVWRALEDGQAPYTAFVHALGPDGKVVSQADLPAGTERWARGQVVTADYELPAAPPGSRLEVGLYDAPTGKRLPVAGGGDSVQLPAVS